MRPLERLRHHVTGAIERGEATPIVEQKAPKSELEQWIADKAQEYAKLEAHAQALAEALRELFAQCAMTHKYWGENSNTNQAHIAITNAHEALARWEAK